MYEEDRQRALGLYAKMFDDCGDEQGLLQHLSSPTKQAVVVARAYNSNSGKLSVHSEAKLEAEDKDNNGVPDYVQAIEKVAGEILPQLRPAVAEPVPAAETAEEEPQEEEVVDENQMTLFDLGAEEESTEDEEDLTVEIVEEPETAEETPAPAESEEEASPAETEDEEDITVEIVEESEETPDETPAAEQPEEGDKPIEYFTLPEEDESAEGETNLSTESAGEGFNINTEEEKPKAKRKPKIFLLILYILFAIPLTLAGIAVLLVPALLFLAAAILCIAGGVVIVSTAFRSGTFNVFADIMVILGAAAAVFALGLLFLWTSIWFVAGAIVSLVHGVATLCDKWCYKEVAA